jgi:hypothetical protein
MLTREALKKDYPGDSLLERVLILKVNSQG